MSKMVTNLNVKYFYYLNIHNLGFSLFTNDSLKEIASSQLLKAIYSGQVSVLLLLLVVINII